MKRDIFVLGASAGGIEAIQGLFAGLPRNFQGTVFSVIHSSPTSPLFLASILGKESRLPVKYADDGEKFRPGQAYLARPDEHLTVTSKTIRLERGPKENSHRPAIDPLFRSAARTLGTRVVGMIFSGYLSDGTLGLLEIKRRGGIAIAQDPMEASVPEMPENAIKGVNIDMILRVSRMPDAMTRLIDGKVSNRKRVKPQVADATLVAASKKASEHGNGGTNTILTCPDCGGVLWELTDGNSLHYRCHVGHTYGKDDFESAQSDRIDQAMWTAIRALEEQATFARRIADHFQKKGFASLKKEYAAKAANAAQRAHLIRTALLKRAR